MSAHLKIEEPQFTGKPHGWIQWKGTDVCIDLHCECGAHLHYDGDFLYYFVCPKCDRLWELGTHITLHPVPPEDRQRVLKEGCVQDVEGAEESNSRAL